MPHVPGVHDHEAPDQPVLPRPLVVPRLRRENRRVDPVWNHANALRGRSLLDQPRSHGVADRDDPVGSPEVEPDKASKRVDEKRVLEPLELDRDLREDVLAHDEQGHTKAPRDRQGHVADHRRIGHAEHEIRLRVGQRAGERTAHERRVVERTTREQAALERRRADADDLDTVPALAPRQGLVLMEDGRDHGDVELPREILGELREQLCRRLDARPVVLVHDQDVRARTRSGHRREVNVRPRGQATAASLRDPRLRTGRVVRRADPGLRAARRRTHRRRPRRRGADDEPDCARGAGGPPHPDGHAGRGDDPVPRHAAPVPLDGLHAHPSLAVAALAAPISCTCSASATRSGPRWQRGHDSGTFRTSSKGSGWWSRSCARCS